ncbi:MAG: restriction endonuclease subunit S [Nocardioidaceae bacterium]
MIDRDSDVALPDGWAAAALGDIADCRLGKMLDQVKNRGEERPYLRNVNVQWGYIALDDIKYMRITTDEEERYAVQPGDLLVCEGGEPGRCAVWRDGREMYLQKALHRVRPRGGGSPDYLRWWLQYSASAGRLDRLLTGSTIKHLPGRQLARADVVLPPVAEQQRIAERLDEIERRQASAQRHLHCALDIVERFRRAVLDAACSGRLTADWRDENPEPTPDIPRSWRRAVFAELTVSIRGGSGEVPTVVTTDLPILRSSSVRPLCINYDDVRYLASEQSYTAANFVEDGDLLVTRLNGNIDYVGNAAVVNGLGDRRLQYPDRLFRLRLEEPAYAAYVELFFASSHARAQVHAASRSAAGHQRISVSDLERFSIDVPPLDEQAEIVRRAGALLATGDGLLARVRRAGAVVDQTASAALAKAFRGELVLTEAALAAEENRDFESAEEILARINTIASTEPSRRPRARV